MKHTENNFTLLRLVLALLVVCGHFKVLPGNHATNFWESHADFAVDAFFVVSGYLIFASYDRRPETGSFYLRRFFRIYPLYFVIIMLQGLAMALVAGDIASHAGELAHYIGFNLIMANFMAYGLGDLLHSLHDPGINPSLWTLKIEVAFYLLLPLAWQLTRRFGDKPLIALYIASVLFEYAAMHYGDITIGKQLPGKMRFFIIGIMLYRHRGVIHLPPLHAFITAGVLLAVCSLRDELWMLPFYPICIGLFVVICALRLPAFDLKHDISYGIYLVHGPLIQFALLLGLFENNTHFLILLLLAATAIALLAERFIERPGIAAGKRLCLLWLKLASRKEKEPVWPTAPLSS
ncbi:MAG TPA: acyltransferase [Rickettsiales bacterium]|nr:acyltransferase [Rickettsiales bacterium]